MDVAAVKFLSIFVENYLYNEVNKIDSRISFDIVSCFPVLIMF